MMNYIWGGMIIVAVIFGFFTGHTDAVAESVLSGAKSAVDMALSLLGMMCFWSGLLEIAKRSGLTEKIGKIIRPVTRLLFPRLKTGSPALSAMVMNMAANFLGLSNAATPLGLTAMAELNKLNPHEGRATDEMCMFVVINTASLSLIPTTVITLRSMAGSSDPYAILIPVWISSACALFVGILTAKLMSRPKRGWL